MNYKKAYGVLFNAITQATDEMEKSFAVTREMTRGIEILKTAQLETEDMYINDEMSGEDSAVWRKKP